MKMRGPDMAPHTPPRSSRPGKAVARLDNRRRGEAVARLVWLVLACVLAGCAAPDTRTAAAAPPGVVEITLLQINDAYVLEPVDGGRRGGMARLATLVKRLRAAHPNVVFAHAGDALSPSPMSTALRGAQMIAVLNALGLDVATFGNHEFDFGPAVLRERVAESRFLWLSANVVERTSGRPFGGAARERWLERGGLRLGLFGLTTTETAATSGAGPEIEFRDTEAEGKTVASDLRGRGAHLVVAVTHQHMRADRALAAAADVDVILGGHEHEPLVAEEGKALITKAGSDARYLVQVDLWLTRDGRLVERSWRFREVSQRIESDPAVEALVRDYAGRLDRELDAVVGKSGVPLEARAARLRTEETNLGDFVADALRERLGSDAAVINGGAIRTNRTVPPGPLTRRDVLSLLPFTDTLVKLEMRGVDLRAALEHGLAQTDREGGGFLQLSGVRLVWDPRLDPGRRIIDVSVGGKPLVDETSYTVAVPAYLVRGGDGYTVFARAKTMIGAESGPQVSQVVLDAIASRGEIAPAVDGRIGRTAR